MSHPPRIVADNLGCLPVFCHASIAGGLVFVSGTLGTKPGGFDLVDGGVGPETRQTLANIRTIVETAGSTVRDIVKVNVVLAELDDFAAMNEAYGEFFANEPPPRMTVAGAKLALGARVEIECIAAAPTTD